MAVIVPRRARLKVHGRVDHSAEKEENEDLIEIAVEEGVKGLDGRGPWRHAPSPPPTRPIPPAHRRQPNEPCSQLTRLQKADS